MKHLDKLMFQSCHYGLESKNGGKLSKKKWRNSFSTEVLELDKG